MQHNYIFTAVYIEAATQNVRVRSVRLGADDYESAFILGEQWFSKLIPSIDYERTITTNVEAYDDIPTQN